MPTLTIEGDVNDMVQIDRETYEPIKAQPTTPEKPKLTRLMELVGSVSKDKKNDFHHYSYASAKAVLDKVQAGLIELGLYSIPTFSIVGTEGDLVTVAVDLGVYEGPGAAIAITSAFGSGSDKGDKAVMKAQTAALKYAWMTLLNIPTGDDPEADTATDARTAAPVSEPQSKGITGAVGRIQNAKVLEVKKKSESPKSPYSIVTDKGTYDTFDKDVVTQMSMAQTTGLVVDFGYKETKWGKDIVKEKPVDA
jgi:hypothetical protein